MNPLLLSPSLRKGARKKKRKKKKKKEKNKRWGKTGHEKRIFITCVTSSRPRPATTIYSVEEKKEKKKKKKKRGMEKKTSPRTRTPRSSVC